MTTTHDLADKQQNRYVTAEGKYTAKVKAPGNGWLGTSKTGSHFIRIPLLIDDPASDQHGREIVWQGWLSEKAAERTAKTLDEAFGREWDIPTLNAGKAPWVGKLCRITIEAEEGEDGKVRLKVRWLNPMTSSQPLPADRLTTLNERILAARAFDATPTDDEISF
jgi:hypothetical protein